MTALIDTNVILDVLLRREPFFEASREVWRACDDRRVEGYMSATSFTNVFYLGRKSVGTSVRKVALIGCLQSFDVAPVYGHSIERALSLRGDDFEDDVQIACAIDSLLDVIVTRDVDGFKASPIPAITPSELMRRLAQP